MVDSLNSLAREGPLWNACDSTSWEARGVRLCLDEPVGGRRTSGGVDVLAKALIADVCLAAKAAARGRGVGSGQFASLVDKSMHGLEESVRGMTTGDVSTYLVEKGLLGMLPSLSEGFGVPRETSIPTPETHLAGMESYLAAISSASQIYSLSKSLGEAVEKEEEEGGRRRDAKKTRKKVEGEGEMRDGMGGREGQGKFIAHQLALVYQSMGRLQPGTAALRRRIEEQFGAIKESTSSGEKLSNGQIHWLRRVVAESMTTASNITHTIAWETFKPVSATLTLQ